jgi:hypothetical protein
VLDEIQIARSWEGRTSRRLRKKIEMLFAHLKRILKLDRLRLRGPTARVTSSSSLPPLRTFVRWPSLSRCLRWRRREAHQANSSAEQPVVATKLLSTFFNGIGQKRTQAV